jgi:hypothetical protein
MGALLPEEDLKLFEVGVARRRAAGHGTAASGGLGPGNLPDTHRHIARGAAGFSGSSNDTLPPFDP